MLLFLRDLLILVLLSKLGVTSWSSMHTPLFDIPRDGLRHPRFIATLFDAYWAFVSSYVWVSWKEPGFAARALWFVAIIVPGNIAMSLYFLRELFRIPAGESMDAVFTRRDDGPVLRPAIPAALGIAIYFVA